MSHALSQEQLRELISPHVVGLVDAIARVLHKHLATHVDAAHEVAVEHLKVALSASTAPTKKHSSKKRHCRGCGAVGHTIRKCPDAEAVESEPTPMPKPASPRTKADRFTKIEASLRSRNGSPKPVREEE